MPVSMHHSVDTRCPIYHGPAAPAAARRPSPPLPRASYLHTATPPAVFYPEIYGGLMRGEQVAGTRLESGGRFRAPGRGWLRVEFSGPGSLGNVNRHRKSRYLWTPNATSPRRGTASTRPLFCLFLFRRRGYRQNVTRGTVMHPESSQARQLMTSQKKSYMMKWLNHPLRQFANLDKAKQVWVKKNIIELNVSVINAIWWWSTRTNDNWRTVILKEITIIISFMQ